MFYKYLILLFLISDILMISLPPKLKIDLDILQRTNNFPGLERLTRLARETHPEITKPQVKQFLEGDTVRQVTAVQHTKPSNGHVVAWTPNDLWLMDIFDLSRYQKSNKDYRYILCCVDVFTRKAFAEPMKLKDSETVAHTFQVIMRSAKGKPNSILSDNDAAFNNDPFRNLLEKETIALNMNAHKDHRVLGIIDNFAKRLKFILTRTFLKSKTTKWIDKLDNIVNVYNRTEHSSLGDVKPNDADKHREDILNINLEKGTENKTVSDLHIGDRVRKSILKGNSGILKGTDPRYSDTVYTVSNVQGQTVTLNDGMRYKRSDLLKVPHDAENTAPNVIHQVKKANRNKPEN